MLGKKHNDETKLKISKSILGKKHSQESIEKMKIVQKGKIISVEQREKISRKLKFNNYLKLWKNNNFIYDWLY